MVKKYRNDLSANEHLPLKNDVTKVCSILPVFAELYI